MNQSLECNSNFYALVRWTFVLVLQRPREQQLVLLLLHQDRYNTKAAATLFVLDVAKIIIVET